MAYENQDSGWSKFRCHARLPGQPDPDEAENDIKKHFRYVSLNSERNPEVNSKGENHA